MVSIPRLWAAFLWAAFLWAALPTNLLCALAAGQTPPRPPVRGAATVAVQPAELRAFHDPYEFSPRAIRLGFEPLTTGSTVEGPLGLYGLRLRLGTGARPMVWVDRTPRSLRPSSWAAIGNQNGPGGPPVQRALREGSGEFAVRATFEVPVNRLGLELRRLDDLELNVILRCFAGGTEIGNLFYDVGQEFTFVGVMSSRPFDEVHVEFTNPSEVVFSLDNVVHELDLRDADRDGWPDLMDRCPNLTGIDQVDQDGDGIGDACDAFPLDPQNDIDSDGFGLHEDNCPLLFNPQQHDSDGDGIGDPCDEFSFGPDGDGDGVGDGTDNCPTHFNPEQADCDLDGVGDVCDPSLVNPPAVEYQLPRGACVTLTKSVCLPPAPPVVDVVIAFDTTGSMGGEIQLLQQSIVGFVNGVRQALPLSDIKFGLVAFKDYPADYTSCNYTARYSRPGDVPFEVKAPIGGGDQQLLLAVNALTARGGKDLPEAYARALWEITQPDSGVGFRANSSRFVLLVGDAPPHDCQLAAFIGTCLNPVSTGGDPGRDGQLGTSDDVDFQRDALTNLVLANIPVLMIYTGVTNPCAWELWCGVTGGTAIHASRNGQLPPGADLTQELVDLIRNPVVDQVTFAAENPCGLDITFDPPLIDGPIDVSLGSQVTFQETICVPWDLPSGTDSIDCEVRVFADDVLIGIQTIHVDVECELHVLDFETEDDYTTPLGNGQTISTPPEFGRLVSISSAGPNLGCTAWDSTPGGPNDPSINSDMLIGHGNLLLLQESARPQQSPPGFFAVPTDDSNGGDIVFTFPVPVDPRSILLADINPPPNMGSYVTLVDEDERTRVYTIEPGWTGPYGNAGPHLLDLTRTDPQPGNGTPRFARAVEQPGFLQDRVIRIVVRMTGYGALDELTFCR